MSTHAHIETEGDFGLGCARLVIEPGAAPDELLFEALCLVRSALGVFEGIADGGNGSDAHHGGLYLLRQASIALTAAQLSPDQAAACLVAGVSP